jgi:hypothetical protein
MNPEKYRAKNKEWKTWGPYVSDRQWGTVREDYSPDGNAWAYTTHDMARSKAYRWGEEGIAGICDEDQLLCFALAFWNKKDPILKERYFGLTNAEGNHGEDVKELYYYLDNTPAHCYQKMLYKYPQQAFPYEALVAENKKRSRQEPEFELLDTGIFAGDKYFDVVVEYAKKSPTQILIQVTVMNRGPEQASLQVLPTLWFRNTWAWGYEDYKPQLAAYSPGVVAAYHERLGHYWLCAEGAPQLLFCDNETNNRRLYHHPGQTGFVKDGINDYITRGADTINHDQIGTRAAALYDLVVPAGGSARIRLILADELPAGFDDFDEVFTARRAEADAFYDQVLKQDQDPEVRQIKRQALAGILWCKQFYYYDVQQWLRGDPAQPPPPPQRLQNRNADWQHVHNSEILSVPDKWEYPWFAAWDMAMHCLPLALVDLDFAKNQLLYLTKEWYMHPNGELPAYEWNFNDSNPPIHALAAWEIYKREKAENQGIGDLLFLEKVFHKLMLNFTWWVNRKDADGNNIFQGGFLGLDNIGVFDRSKPLPSDEYIDQADGTSWMAMYSLNLLRIAHELSLGNAAYSDISAKFFEHFLYIAGAIHGYRNDQDNLWDEEDRFYYDRLRHANKASRPLKVRSLVGLIPLLVVEVLPVGETKSREAFYKRMEWFKQNRPELAQLVSLWDKKNEAGLQLVSLLRGFRMKKILERMLDEKEFLSDYGVRSLSKFHLDNPFSIHLDGQEYGVRYTPGESDSDIFGGNSNWRGPVWLPLNMLIIDGLRRFHAYYGPGFKVECPTGSGILLNLNEVADELSRRIMGLFKRNDQGWRPVFGSDATLQTNEHFKDHLLFYEYFHGDTGQGLGASHQTGWTALVANLMVSDQ